jgi:hypothetical protein
MLRFFNKLFRDFRTTNSSRGKRRAPRRAMLQLEGLEDRLVLSSSALRLSFAPSQKSAGSFPGRPK